MLRPVLKHCRRAVMRSVRYDDHPHRQFPTARPRGLVASLLSGVKTVARKLRIIA